MAIFVDDDPFTGSRGRMDASVGVSPYPASLSARPAVPSLAGRSAQPLTGASAPAASGPFGFDDPATSFFLSALSSRLSSLAAPGPSFGESEAALRAALRPDPTITSVIKTLASRMGRPSVPGNPHAQQFVERTNARIAELQAEPFSEGDEAALRASFFDEDERDRQAAKQQVLERMGALGHAPTSGPVIEALLEVDRAFDQRRAMKQRDLLTYIAETRQARRSEAQQLAAALAQMGAQEQALAAQLAEAGYGYGLQAAQLAMAQQQRAAQTALMLSELQRQRYLDNQGRLDAILNLSQIPMQLTTDRFRLLLDALGASQSAQAQAFSQWLAQQQLGIQREQIGQQNRAAWLGLLGNVGGGILQDFLRSRYGG